MPRWKGSLKTKAPSAYLSIIRLGLNPRRPALHIFDGVSDLRDVALVDHRRLRRTVLEIYAIMKFTYETPF